jgi:tetratricopeptide (TPR) repeat protein
LRLLTDSGRPAFPSALINSLLFLRSWHRSWLWLGLLPAVLLGSCASDKGLISHSFNNIAARDNAYFIAREKLRAIEATLYKERVNDYNAVLPLFPTLDSTTVRAGRADLNDIIKKASMPIQHRPGSDWTDDAYLVVGWARFYKMEFDDAALTFKYVNTTSKDANARHEALIGLMRTFVATKQFDNAKSVSDLLDKEVGKPEDARELFLTRADYYLKTDDLAQAIAQLERAIPLIEQKNERGRTRYVLAQLYQESGKNKEAYTQLNEILKRNPPYELDFFAKLMLGQVSELGAQDQARLDKYFAALLKDPNNLEYRDKIYYEMARVDYRKQNYPSALKLLSKSVRMPSKNKTQKSYTYLLTGRIYYENLHKYRLAAAYYDSTVQSMSKEAPTYAAIKERSEILTEFAKQYTIVETQDSLQALAKLTPGVLDAKLNEYAAAEIEAQKKETERQAALQKERARADELASRGGSSSTSMSSPSALQPGQRDILDPTAQAAGTGGVWYFDNPATLVTARSDFQRRWGNRALQDNWRINSQSAAPTAAQPGSTLADNQNPGGVPGQGANGEAIGKTASPEAAQSTLVAKYRQGIPDTPEKLLASNAQIESALYALGGIYKEQLKERDKGYETYATQVTRFPRGTNAPDAYYLLYLHYKDLANAAKVDEYAAALQREFPNSIYAKLIRDPQYREHELALHNAVAVRVDSAFDFYKNQEFRKARAVLARTEAKYPTSDLNDRVAYLSTLLAIRTQAPPTARTAVEAFYKKYPDSPLVPQAQALASTYKKYEANQIVGALASTEKPAVSIFRPGEVDNRLRIFYGANETPYVAPTPDQPAPTSTPTAAPTPSVPPKPIASAPVASPAGSAGPAPAASGAPSPVAAPAPSAPETRMPVKSAAPEPASGITAPASAPVSAAPEAPAAPATAYTTQMSAMHAVVLVFPKGAPTAAELPTQFTAYNNRFFRANNLQVQSQPLDAAQELLVVRSLPGAKVAQSYATKLRGPQSPVAKLRGAGYQTLVISIENLNLLQASGDLAGYLSFFQRTYK